MSSPLDKGCTGARCEQKERCPLYLRKPASPFNYISPLDTHEECPHWPPYGWVGEGND